jgi:5-methylcytosine-specific restriction endonuclease McrA
MSPRRALTLCAQGGCRTLVSSGRCARHERAGSYERGYDAAWRRVRADFLAAFPRCVGYGPRQGKCDGRATEADHVVAVRDAPHLRLHWSNLRPYCKSCHSRRTATEQRW